MELKDILVSAVDNNASDIFFIVGQPIAFKIRGKIRRQGFDVLTKDIAFEYIMDMYRMADERSMQLLDKGDDDFAIAIPGYGRFRANIFRQRGTVSAVLRVVSFDLMPVADMGIPDSVIELSKHKKGLILVTGTAGSGKSTTLSYIIDMINKTRNCHILTIEDPIEFLHKHDKSIVSQREIGIDTENYSTGLKAALREAPDVIFIGELNDLETIETALTAAETGHLVLSTLHTVGAANTIDRIIDIFPANQQQQIRVQLSMVLSAIVSQQLLPTMNDGLVPAFEIMDANGTIRTLIREGRIYQVDSVINSAIKEGMMSMDRHILDLFRMGKIDADTAIGYAMNPDIMKRNVSPL